MKDEKELTYEEQVQREFELSQESGSETKTVKDLGRVDITRGTHTDGVAEDENVQRINQLIGFHNVPLETLPSQGRYYPEGTRISIRSARVGEIREFSTIDENDLKDVTDKMTYILSQCVKIFFGNTQGHYKDIITADRIILILKIRELTFTEGLSGIKVPVPDNACSTPGCHPQDHIVLSSNKISFAKPSEELEKYYDPVARCYTVLTKSYGSIHLYIPSVGVTSVIADWIRKQQQEGKKFDASLIEILQFTIKDWRGLSDRAIFAQLTELSGWDTRKFTLVYRLIEKLSVGIEFELTDVCEQCGGEIKVPLSFPNGYRELLVPTVSDLGDELL